MVTNKKNKIIEFPAKIGTSSPPSINDDSQNFGEYEEYEDDEYFYLLEEKDYPGLIQYCMDRAAENPDDLHAKAQLGSAYILNGNYEKALSYLTECHQQYPEIDEYQHLLLDALFGMGMTEDDYDWSRKPVVLRLNKNIIDASYLYLKPKRKPRSIYDIHNEFVLKGYVTFTPEDLLLKILDDQRIVADDPDDKEMLRAVRKKDLKKLRKDN
jgi:tetratricopeptide (TPR) repeat protein